MSGEGAHEYEEDQIVRTFVPDTVIFPRPCNHDLAGYESLLLPRYMKATLSLDDVIDLFGPDVPVDPLLLPGSQTVEIAEVMFGSEERYFLHLLIGKTNRTQELP